jgi:hypothetical protein
MGKDIPMKDLLLAATFALQNTALPAQVPLPAPVIEPVPVVAQAAEKEKNGDISIIFTNVSRPSIQPDLVVILKQQPLKVADQAVDTGYPMKDRWHVQTGDNENGYDTQSGTGGDRIVGSLPTGLVTGYKMKSRLHDMPYVRVSPRDSDINLRVNVVPPVKGVTSGTVGVQMRVKF